MKEVTDAFGNWFAGFTAGEGCFAIGNNKRSSSCAKYECKFAMDLRDDDKQILEEVHDALGIGTIHSLPTRLHGNYTIRAQAKFRVSAIKDCVELVRFFEKYPLRAKKQRDFEIWKQAVAELSKPLKCRDADLLEYYYHKIQEVRQYEEQDELERPIIKELQLTLKFE